MAEYYTHNTSDEMKRVFIHLLRSNGWVFDNLDKYSSVYNSGDLDIDPRYERSDIILGCTYRVSENRISILITTSEYNRVVEFGFDCEDIDELQMVLGILIDAQNDINFDNYSDTIKNIMSNGTIVFWEIQGFPYDKVSIEELPAKKFERKI